MKRIEADFGPLKEGHHRFVLVDNMNRLLAATDVAIGKDSKSCDFADPDFFEKHADSTLDELGKKLNEYFVIDPKKVVLNVDRLSAYDVGPNELLTYYTSECERVFLR
jgi:hypothetical protein